MLSFSQFIQEERHYAPGVNGDWGFLTKNGTVRSGMPHSGIKDHNKLAKKLKLGNTDHEAVRNGHTRFYVMQPGYDPHCTVQSPDSLSVEVSHNHASNLHKHIHKLIDKNDIKPQNVRYDVVHHGKTTNPDDDRHDSLTHREFAKKYGS